MNKDSFILVITTIHEKQAAKKLANLLLNQKLAACIQIDAVESLYSWQDEILGEKEYRLMIKTAKNKYSQLETAIKENHPYQVPEIIAVNIETGFNQYLDWIKESTKIT